MIVVPFTEELVPKVKEFNTRLHRLFPKLNFSETPVAPWLPKLPGRDIYQEYFLAMDEEGAVRGAYILKHQSFRIKGRTLSIGNYQLPVSEGICDPAYGCVGLHILLDALERQPLLYSLGMGGMGEALPKLLKAANWTIFPVPFYFKVVSPFNFLRKVVFLRRKAHLRFALDFLAYSGLGWLGVKCAQAFAAGKSVRGPQLIVEEFQSFGPWADELWERAKDLYDFSAVRDAKTLNILYPERDKRFIKLKVSSGGMPLGWAVMLDTQMTAHKHFGSLRLGSIVDCLSCPEDAPAVASSATRLLEGRGVHLIVSNQMHWQWGRALSRAGFLSGPSNFLLAVSEALAELLQPAEVVRATLHTNRGDGDGPINL